MSFDFKYKDLAVSIFLEFLGQNKLFLEHQVQIEVLGMYAIPDENEIAKEESHVLSNEHRVPNKLSNDFALIQVVDVESVLVVHLITEVSASREIGLKDHLVIVEALH
jgi:hypothetical protein